MCILNIYQIPYINISNTLCLLRCPQLFPEFLLSSAPDNTHSLHKQECTKDTVTKDFLIDLHWSQWNSKTYYLATMHINQYYIIYNSQQLDPLQLSCMQPCQSHSLS